MAGTRCREKPLGVKRNQREKLARVVGYAVSATCLAVLAFRVDWPLFATHFANAHLLPIAFAGALLTSTYALFALRWRLLLSFDPKLPLIQVASFLMLGYVGNLVLPMRAGDAARVLLVRNAYGHGTARALSSILLERLLDVLAVLLFGAAVSLAAALPDALLVVLRSSAAIVILAILLFGWIAVRPMSAVGVAESFVRPFSPTKSHAVAYQIKQFAEALKIMVPRDRNSIVRVVAIVVLTGLGWGSFGGAMILCVAAFGVAPAVAAGLLLMVVTNLGSAIPSSPGSIGVYHALGVLALSTWNVGLDLALSVATVSHALVVSVQLLLGLLAIAAVGKQKSVLKGVWKANSDN